MPSRMEMIAMTIISSISVKPQTCLPIRIGRAIRRFLRGFGIDVEYVLTAEALGLGIVLVASHSPVRRFGEGVAGNAAQEADLSALGVVGELDPLYEHIQAVGITVRVDLGGSDLLVVASVLVFVDGA